jgi:hypothetical protein
MITLRSNDFAGSSFFTRTDRIFNDCDSGLWYFRTREGSDIGPFRYRSEAEAMLGRFIIGVSEARSTPIEKLRFRLNARVAEA